MTKNFFGELLGSDLDGYPAPYLVVRCRVKLPGFLYHFQDVVCRFCPWHKDPRRSYKLLVCR